MRFEDITNDEIKPRCPKCGGLNFGAAMENLQRGEKAVVLVVCVEDGCRAVLGALPYDAVWNGKP